MKKLWFACLLLIPTTILFGANPSITQETLDWYDSPIEIKITEKESITLTSFETAVYDIKHPTLPIFTKTFPLDNYGDIFIEISNEVYEPLNRTANEDDEFLSSNLSVEQRVEISRREAYGTVSFIPIRKNELTGDYEKLVSFTLKSTLRVKPFPTATNTASRNQNSILADGDIYKIAVSETGIHKLTYDFLKNELGIDNIDNIDPRNIQLLGDGGGVLPQSNESFRYTDVPENAIYIEGEGDGQFNTGDFILFYAESADDWYYNESDGTYLMNKNPYSFTNHYYIKIGSSNGKRIQNQSSISNTNYTTSTFDYYTQYETDLVNLLDEDLYRYGTGKIWFGETFKFTRTQTFDFNIPNIENNSVLKITAAAASRDVAGSSGFAITANGQNVGTLSFVTATSTNVTKPVARSAVQMYTVANPSSNTSIGLTYQASANAEGWLNYLNVNARRNLVFNGGQMSFRDRNSLDFPSTTFQLSNAANTTIWDVTNSTEVKKQLGSVSGNNFSFGINTDELREFVVFDGSQYLTATAVGDITNQNLHSLTTPDMLIIYHPKFKDAVDKLANHRRDVSNMQIETVPIESIYNEFSSGSTDVTGIRDFVKYLYDNGANLKYLMLFGDASFDFRNISNLAEPQQYIPTFETQESLDPISGFPTDDYYGLLDLDEGSRPHDRGLLDIGIGRIPVTTVPSALSVVDKIIRYETESSFYGDWKNNITFMADDEDNNTHARDANTIADRVRNKYPYYNVDKIFIDAYRQEVLSAGERYPAAERAINAKVFKGNLVMCYLGHGDSEGLTQERVIDINKVNTWNNPLKMPLFVTATCSFGPYDDHNEVSIGEQIFLRPDGGAIAMLTTTRLVFAGQNKALTQSVFDNVFEQVGTEIPPLGEIMRKAKNSCSGCISNSRKFTLLGDPSMKLKYPEHEIVTTSVNGIPAITKDTIQALEEVTITGEIRDKNGNLLSDFNGTVYPTIFDKIKTKSGLGNDAGSRPALEFDVQNNILFRGRAAVENGQFSFKFIVPKDIDYQYGYGKISYYADDGMNEEAWGYYDTIYIGGTFANAIVDDEGPEVEVFLNDENFVFGGLTDENPVIYVKLSDDIGINTSDAGIGHGISAVLDENTQQTYSLNDFYESELNSYRQGIAKYPLTEIAEGRHQITVKAWDVANNSGTGYTEFVVASTANAALDHVLNYPNPFTTSTEFQFEHNLPGQPMQVQVQIFTVSGKLVKTIQQEVISEGYRVTGIEWDGLDDFGNQIGRGVYVYKVSIGLLSDANQVTTSTSEFQKLVILR